MTPEQELLDRVRRALAEADVDAGDLVATAYEQARDEVAGVLRRMIVQDLLARALGSLGGQAPSAEGPSAEAPPAGAPPAGQTSAGQRPAGGPAPGLAAEVLTYVFGVTARDAAIDLRGLERLPGGGTVRVVAGDGVQALVCDVDPATFEVLRAPGPEGLDTLAAAALAHDAILAAIARETTVLPLQLGTAVPDDATVADLLRAHGTQLRGELDRLAGHAEWSVTVQLLEDDDRDGDEAARSASSGSDYLHRRSASLGRRSSRFEHRERLARHLHAQLAAVAEAAETVTSRPVDDVAPPLLHGIYLLADTQVAQLEEVVAALRAEHAEAVIEIGGPWPPYHFSAVELAAPPGAEA